MKMKLALILAILLVGLPCIYALDTSNWHEITVNKVNFKIPDKYFNESGDANYEKSYSYNNLLIVSCVDYNTLKHNYGSDSTGKGIIDIEQSSLSGHDLIHIYDNYHSPWNKESTGLNKSYVFFSTGNKIFEISFKGEELTEEIQEIIKSTPESKMSEETFLNKLDNAQRDYIREDYEKNLELDLEDYYRIYNDEHNRESFYYFGSNGFGVGGSTRL